MKQQAKMQGVQIRSNLELIGKPKSHKKIKKPIN